MHNNKSNRYLLKQDFRSVAQRSAERIFKNAFNFNVCVDGARHRVVMREDDFSLKMYLYKQI